MTKSDIVEQIVRDRIASAHLMVEVVADPDQMPEELMNGLAKGEEELHDARR